MLPLIFYLFLFSPFNVCLVVGETPLTPKASAIRYWNTHISNDLSKPWFLLNKASPLDAVQLARFSKLAHQNSLSTQLPAFCSQANLFCFPDGAYSTYSDKHGYFKSDGNGAYSTDSDKHGYFKSDGNDPYSTYSDKHGYFKSDGNGAYSTYSDKHGYFKSDDNGAYPAYSDKHGYFKSDGSDPYSTYSDKHGYFKSDGNGAYSTYSDKHGYFKSDDNGAYPTYSDKHGYFKSDGNANDPYSTYSDKHGYFKSDGNDPYSTYSDKHGYFKSDGSDPYSTYSDKHGYFKSDGNDPYSTYSDKHSYFKTDGKDPYSTYSDKHGYFKTDGNDPYSTYSDKHGYFKMDGNDPYSTYSDKQGFFYGYDKSDSNDPYSTFSDKHGYFKSDGNGAYSDKHGYFKSDSAPVVKNGQNRWVQRLEPGIFFREENLRTGTIMPMPDIEDNMPKRSFLPPSIVSKMPFSVSEIPELHQIFNAKENSTMAKMIKHTLTECERVPSKGENKRCIASVEGMVDFATSVLGSNVVVRTTENTAGSKGDILIGSVKGINGGNVTKSVSCHQSLFPYLVYYCHTVAKIHVYEADILDPKTKNKINHGVAICHLDTSAWSPTHAAFLALGSGPGKIEVCHWIFENDMTWATAD